MNEYIETAYEEFCSIVTSTLDRESCDVALERMLMRLGDASTELENMIYERLGLSSDEIVDLVMMGEILH